MSAQKEPIYHFIQSERGFYIGHEPAGFGGVEGDPMWDKNPLEAKGFLKNQRDVDSQLKIVRWGCKGLEMWQVDMTESELVVYEVLSS